MRTLPLIVIATLLAEPLLAQEPESEEPPVTTRVSGTVVGADGQPMEMAHVSLYPAGGGDAEIFEVSADGTYTLEIEGTGVFRLWFTGVDHLLQSTPLLLTGEGGELVIDARLGMHEFEEDFSDVAVIGDFNEHSFSNDTRQMEPRDDGTYYVEIEWEADSLAYQVISVAQGRSINGTQSDRFVYDSGGDYRSVVPVEDGVARIVFDPEKRLVSDVEPEVRFGDPDGVEARYADFVRGMTERRDEYYKAYRALREEDATEEELTTFSEGYDWSQNDAGLEAWLSETTDADLRASLLIAYLSNSVDADSLYARMALAEIPPGSPHWASAPQVAANAIYSTGEPEVYEDFAYAMLRENEDDDLKAGVLMYLLWTAHQDEGKQGEERILYSWLVSEFPESSEARFARAEFDPNRAVQPGRPVPEFEVAALEDSTVMYSGESLLGQVYLMDFWAVWCGPCIAEMPNLHAAYEKYQEDGFTILSLSFDEKPEEVIEFRAKGEWTMPWLHAFVEDGFGSELAKTFQVIGIPKPILVDVDGTIIATFTDLRGENLDKTLAEHFGREPTVAETEGGPSGR